MYKDIFNAVFMCLHFTRAYFLQHKRSGRERGRLFAFESTSVSASMQWASFVELILTMFRSWEPSNGSIFEDL